MRQDNITGAFCIQFDRFLCVMRDHNHNGRGIYLSNFTDDISVYFKIRDGGNNHLHFREMQFVQKFHIRSIAVDALHPFFTKRGDYFRIMIDDQESLPQSLEESDQIMSYPLAAQEYDVVV